MPARNRHTHKGPYEDFDRAKVWEIISPHLRLVPLKARDGKYYKAHHLNGRKVDPTDMRALRSWRAGQYQGVSLRVLDRICSRYDLQMWEFEEAALD